MNLVFYKLSNEIRTFTLIQFLGAMVGSISALYFYSQGKVASSEYYFAAQAACVLTLLIIGLCDFFIHRNAQYLKSYKFADAKEIYSFEAYEQHKASHWTTKFVVPTVMFIFGLVLVVVYTSCPASKNFWFSNISAFFLMIALIIFVNGAWLGRIGWEKKWG